MLSDRARRGAAAPIARPSPRWHALSAEEALAAIDSDGDRGLSAEEATRRLARLGRNALPAPPRRSLAAVILGQLASPLVSLLGVAALVALVFGEVGDALVIAAVVVLNAGIGAVQEGRAERSLAALRRLVRHRRAWCATAKRWSSRPARWCREISSSSRRETRCRPTRACCTAPPCRSPRRR